MNQGEGVLNSALAATETCRGAFIVPVKVAAVVGVNEPDVHAVRLPAARGVCE
jgi:hypothetical protein